MGFSIAYAAFRSIEKGELLKRLGLEDTDEPDPYSESPFSGSVLSSGWYLVWSNDFMWGVDENKFLELSVEAEVLVSLVDETSMTFVASGYSKGSRSWSVVHDAQNNLMHLDTEGTMPPSFKAIRQRNVDLQEAEAEAVDHYASIPPEVFASITGFRYDDARHDVVFTALVQNVP